ncbi:MAG: DUF2334 domain-containing protein [Bacteroidetes bacterium]|nr:DUF2334 domain-containing protein [Bacteroidota bacterium]
MTGRFIRLVLVAFLVAPTTVDAQDSLFFAIRLDDIHSRSSIAPRTLVPLELIVEARGARLSYGVIPHRLIEPQNQDGVLASELKQSVARGHEIMMHGYTHICPRCGQSSHEMFCTRDGIAFDYSQQSALVEAGMSVLDTQLGMVPSSFVPPGHHADLTTAQVLSDKNFDVMSTAGYAEQLTATLFNMPPSEEFTWALTEWQYDDRLQDALATIRDAGDTYILLLHDPFTRPGYENAMLDSLSLAYGDRFVPTTVSGIAQRAQRIASTDTEYARALVIEHLLPYPNPASSTVTVTLERSGPLDLFDMQGRHIRSLGPQEAGSYQFDVEDLARGTYVLRQHHAQGVHYGLVVRAAP